jgi:anthranilate phosphoribosyltransferase
MATIERFVNPVQADIIIASAFHPPYGEKMLTLCERAGFPAAIIVRNGIEGTIAFPLKRAAKILCSKRQADGTYLRHEFEINPSEHLKTEIPVEEKFENPSLAKNAELVQTYVREGKTGYDLFDLRVQLTCLGLEKGLNWI